MRGTDGLHRSKGKYDHSGEISSLKSQMLQVNHDPGLNPVASFGSISSFYLPDQETNMNNPTPSGLSRKAILLDYHQEKPVFVNFHPEPDPSTAPITTCQHGKN